MNESFEAKVNIYDDKKSDNFNNVFEGISDKTNKNIEISKIKS